MSLYPIRGTVSLDTLPSTVTKVLNPSDGVYAFSAFTLVDRSHAVPGGRTITSIGLYLNSAVNTKVKVVKRLSAGSYQVIGTQNFAHPGSGWADCVLASPLLIPDGEYYLGAYIDACQNNLTASVPRAYVQGSELTGTGSLSEDTSLTLPMRYAYVSDTTSKATVSYEVAPAVLLVLGQSNSAAYLGTGLYTITHTDGSFFNVNYSNGSIANASEPLAGVDGGYSSFVSRLGDSLLDDGVYKKVVVANVAVGGSTIASWAPGGSNHSRIATALSQLASLGYIPTHILWGHGESDAANGISQNDYATSLNAIINSIRQKGVSAPFLVALETVSNGHPASSAVRAAQASVANGADVFVGPDLDVLGSNYRYDGTHFNAAGAAQAADLWKAAVTTHA